MRTASRRRPGPLPLLLLAGLLRAAAAAGADPPPVDAAPARGAPPGRAWSLAPDPVAADGGLRAVAVGPAGAVAAGDARGLLVRLDGAWRRIPLRGAVSDVAFAPDGALWIASDEGLFRLAADPAAAAAGWRLVAHPVAPGDAARVVVRVAARAGALAVATQDGVYWSRDGRRFARVEGGFAEGDADADEEDASFDADGGERAPSAAPAATPPVSGLALASAPDGAATLWIAARRGLFRARLASRDGAARVRAERLDPPAALRPALAVALWGDDVLALGADALVYGDAAGMRWRAYRPELPPGAQPARLLATAHGLWIATDRGLLEAERPGASWRRADEPAGTTPAAAVAAEGERLLVASAQGLLVGEPSGERPAAPARTAVAPPPPGAFACDPPIVAVQRAALAHLDLTGARTARMWRGVRRRGVLPVVTLDGAIADDRRHNRTWDEAFTSGETRRLFDRDRDRLRERAISLRLVWDLPDLLYEPEEIDVSTEMRRTIELRDDVLDELNQLYFDRRRALDLAAQAGPGKPEAAREALRAEELAAGLDGWTGGWFGARAGRAPCPGGDG